MKNVQGIITMKCPTSGICIIRKSNADEELYPERDGEDRSEEVNWYDSIGWKEKAMRASRAPGEFL